MPLTAPFDRLHQALQDRYRIERELGAGGMAVVYLATDLRQNRTVALKVLRPELASLIGPERFLREIDIAGKLNHPHILPVFEAGEADGLPYYVMPFIEGESLRDRLVREHQLPIADAVQIVREVADALDYAHAQGIIHRDIKPENIMLSRGHAVVADFGIARAVTAAGGADKLTGTGMAIGTVDYMSPEQATGTGQVDARSDQYSLGCVTYELLAGGPPFVAPTSQGVLARHLVDPVPPIRTLRSTVPPHMEAAILAALAKAPADRFPSAGAFVEALEGKRPSPSQPYPAARDPRARRRPRVFVAASVVGVLLAAVVAYLALRSPTMDDHRVLVGVFDNRTGDAALASLGSQATTEVASGLTSLDSMQVVDARSVSGDSGAVRDLVALRQLARKQGAGSVVLGAYHRRGDSLEVEVQMIDATTGNVLRPLRPVSGLIAAPAAVVAELRTRVMAGYAAHFDPRFHNYATVSQPANYEAYREFVAGDAFRGSDPGSAYPKAETHLRRAIAADSGFMAPRIRFVMLTTFTGQFIPRGDSAAVALRAARVGLLPADEAALRMYHAWGMSDRRAMYDAAVELYRLAPDFSGYAEWRAIATSAVGRPREVIAFLQDTDRARLKKAQGGYWNYLIAAYHQLGLYQKGLDAVAQWRRGPGGDDDALVDRYEMRQRAALGQVEQVNRLIDQRVGKSNLDATGVADPRAGQDMWFAGQELRGHGYPEAGKAVCDRAVAWFAARPTAERAAHHTRANVATALHCAERWEEARVLYQQLVQEDSSDVNSRSRLGALAARRKDLAEVASTERWLAARDSEPDAIYGRAVLAALGGDRPRAVALLQQWWERRPEYQRAHTDPDLESLHDYAPYRALLNPGR